MPEESPPRSPYSPRYWPLWVLIGLLRLIVLLPWTWAMAFGRALGRLAMSITPRRVRIARINLDLCFPELSEEERERLVRRHFESLGMGIMDVMFAWWASDEEFARLTRVHGAQHLEPAFAGGKGAILLTAHLTSVEVSGRILARLAPVLAMYRRNENPAIEHIMKRNRERHVEQTIPRDDVRLMVRTLRANKGVWFAPDQNYGQKNRLFSPFFGILASTNTATSRFAHMTGARVVPFVVLRREDGEGYDLHIEPALENFPSDDLQRDTDRVNAMMERWIRQAPAQYFWSHRRFKDRPAGEQGFY